MDKQVPIYFDTIIASPIERISEANPNIGRLKVGVFTRYGNRNGSYIKDEVAEQLIRSATAGDTPVVGFFDPETKDWAGHTGPTLASAYGYVEEFIGWEPLRDSDGETREYAIFQVVLFTKYFDEAKFISGCNQSMELNRDGIEGNWADIGGTEYFVYTKAEIEGLCVIGSHEPCFSASAFFSKKDEQYESQHEKFASILFDLKHQLEEAEKGGELPMNENDKLEPEFEATEPEVQEPEQEPEVQEPEIEPASPEGEPAEEPAAEPEGEPEEASEPSEFEALQAQLEELQNSYNTLNEQYSAAQAHITELENFQSEANAELETLRTQNTELQASIEQFTAERIQYENERKNALVEKYERVLDEEEIAPIREQAAKFSYEDLESKLAICFSNKNIAGGDAPIEKVPLPEPPESEFALMMKKYRKN